jgi:CheY-like chemotaxis protein
MDHPRVLVVDDDVDVGGFLREALSRWGYDVTLATSGREAVRLISHQIFDAALVDIWMPEMDGLQVLEEIKRHDPALEVVMMTGNPMVALNRAIAAAIDGGMIFVAFGLFLFAFHCMGGMFHLNRQTIPFFAAVFGTLALFYGMLWIWAGRDTVGMRCTGLRLIDFDGFPASRRCRLVRSLGTWLSFCAGGIGLLWALADEEKLAWHDHMSKTFPTLQESNSTFFRKP